MPNATAAQPAGVLRVVFRQIVAGDFRKFKAESNDADSGGGARDLRFRPYPAFRDIFADLLPSTRIEKRRRNGIPTDTEIRVGAFFWSEGNGKEASKEATFEPPTDARPNEGRIPVVHTYPPFNTLPATTEGKMVALLIQREDGNVWPAFATEEALRSGQWNTGISDFILKSLDANRPQNQVARGFIDFVARKDYSDA